jgi:hypothetical protein
MEGWLVSFLRIIVRRIRVQTLPALLALILAASGIAQAQWANATYPGTPRSPDGKPNLSELVPRTPKGKPDLSGVWHAESFRWVHLLREAFSAQCPVAIQ